MEDWEKELREKLDKELPSQLYNIGTGDVVCYTGKKGYIDFEVSIHKAIKDYNEQSKDNE